MALQGPFAVIADSPAPDVVEALRAAGARFRSSKRPGPTPRDRARFRRAGSGHLAEPCPDRACANALAAFLAEQRRKAGGLYMPVIARTRDDGAAAVPDALAIAATAPAQRLVRRLPAGAAHPHLHGTVLRRTERWLRAANSCRHCQRAIRSTKRPCWSPARPFLSGSHGRGRRTRRRGRRAHRRERGARAQRRDIDGMVIGDGFSARIVELC